MSAWQPCKHYRLRLRAGLALNWLRCRITGFRIERGNCQLLTAAPQIAGSFREPEGGKMAGSWTGTRQATSTVRSLNLSPGCIQQSQTLERETSGMYGYQSGTKSGMETQRHRLGFQAVTYSAMENKMTILRLRTQTSPCIDYQPPFPSSRLRGRLNTSTSSPIPSST